MESADKVRSYIMDKLDLIVRCDPEMKEKDQIKHIRAGLPDAYQKRLLRQRFKDTNELTNAVIALEIDFNRYLEMADKKRTKRPAKVKIAESPPTYIQSGSTGTGEVDPVGQDKLDAVVMKSVVNAFQKLGFSGGNSRNFTQDENSRSRRRGTPLPDGARRWRDGRSGGDRGGSRRRSVSFHSDTSVCNTTAGSDSEYSDSEDYRESRGSARYRDSRRSGNSRQSGTSRQYGDSRRPGDYRYGDSRRSGDSRKSRDSRESRKYRESRYSRQDYRDRRRSPDRSKSPGGRRSESEGRNKSPYESSKRGEVAAKAETQSRLQNLVKFQIPKDNCLFRAISYGVYGRQGDFLDIKYKINEFICQNWEFFRDFACDGDGQPVPSLQKFKQSARKADRLGDFSDIVAASHVFQVPITVYQGNDITYVGEGHSGSRLCLLLTAPAARVITTIWK